MTLVPTRTLMSSARAAGRGLGAFNVIHLETASALVRAAEHAGLPVILQLSQNCIAYHGDLDPIARAMLTIAERSSAEIAVHLDHAEDLALVHRAVDLGFGSVMYDGSALDFADNVAHTRRATAYAHASDCYVEAELGRVGGKDGAHAPGVRTDPTEAKDFVDATGADALAVAVGSSHAMRERTAELDHDLIRRLRSAVPVPLVLHGSSGVPDGQIVRAIRAGMTKINVSTQLNTRFTAAVREVLAGRPDVVDSRVYIARGADAVTAEAERLLRVFALEPDTTSHPAEDTAC
ncbi:class II fructose-bisphosphate aldolase [Microbacterium sp. dk485]|uniref:class II fructose-bisphosphate aldolase n=1 Tax=Microbacterium TaxID=33882 RepID=UPI00107327A4|nr:MULTISPECIES: class II fructose-bisphosphate aldolase [Microbacterium]TFV82234.1 class II fructose-bisphosphate aldolase [Microbacterium sp. dk485]TXK20437.1 class II fructose-bisphosphate aldolase [Microbacterium wangchenii]